MPHASRALKIVMFFSGLKKYKTCMCNFKHESWHPHQLLANIANQWHGSEFPLEPRGSLRNHEQYVPQKTHLNLFLLAYQKNDRQITSHVLLLIWHLPLPYKICEEYYSAVSVIPKEGLHAKPSFGRTPPKAVSHFCSTVFNLSVILQSQCIGGMAYRLNLADNW